jgi:hypothetical protein
MKKFSSGNGVLMYRRKPVAAARRQAIRFFE